MRFRPVALGVFLLFSPPACGSSNGPAAGGDAQASDAVASPPGDGPVAEMSVDGEASDASEAVVDSGASDASTPDVTLPGVDPSADLAGLSQTQLGELCDWYAMLYGGYNVSASCPPNGNISTAMNQAQCLATLHFRCSVTVSQFETCAEVQLPSHGCVMGQPQCSFQNC